MADPHPTPGPARPEGGAPAAAPVPAGEGPPDSDPSSTGRPDSDASDSDPSDTVPPGTAAARVRCAPGRYDTRALVRAQLRIALQTAAIVLAVTAAIPALLALAQGLGGIRPFGLPPSWLLPVLGVQPLWVITALVQLHRAERAERDHTRPAGRA
ncbi:hypothetical protein amrb99_57720 [Actinomadura sp. RB99]|uniref:hypothetical protein n=1 Tax=Actinomadura sp. RB99 TaxID=2691577 RepID=UPI0016827200|nr:hypothetical protein [Actinomadura sp. RB99]MBD2896821.1 hypothetical protein [Actinomadura sp. RB99]